jgi:hypothetical protein
VNGKVRCLAPHLHARQPKPSLQKTRNKIKRKSRDHNPLLVSIRTEQRSESFCKQTFFIWQLLQTMEFDAKMHLSWRGKEMVQLPSWIIPKIQA